MNLKIIGVGKIKEKYFLDGIQEYIKRCSPFCNINIIEAKEVNTLDINKNIYEEGKNILGYLKNDEYVIALTIEGNMLDSIALAKLLDDKIKNSISDITFIIGGSNGLDKEVIKRANYLLSFGKITYPHQLMRLVLMEQIYRSFMIINNRKYHK